LQVEDREWGIGSGEWGSKKLFHDSPLPTPHSPLPFFYSAIYFAFTS
jgi:hypothetical protein